MSVLKFPRLYFHGLISWDPDVTNNDPDVYDGANADILLPNGVTYDTFKQWVINNLTSEGNWNYYGTHTCQFVENQTFITGGVISPGGPLITADPLVNQPVQLQGKLVDLDPAITWSSQIFFDNFSFGDGQTGATAGRYHRMHSRWLNFRRNLNLDHQMKIAGVAAVVWQTVFPLQSLNLTNAANSPLLKALGEAIRQGDAQGLMVRFCSYRTLYFQNGILNNIPQQPRSTQELQTLYSTGQIFSNPAYSLVAGVIGVWNLGELASVPGGRYLAASAAVKPTNAAGSSVTMGPCVAEFDRANRLISVDFNSTIPEIDSTLTKADFGPLTLAVSNKGAITPIATIKSDRYARPAYESSAGIIDIVLDKQTPADLMDKIEAGQLVLQVQQGGQMITAMSEPEFVAQADERDIYLNQNSPQAVSLHVRQRGKAAPQGTHVLLARFGDNGNPLGGPQILDVGADGTATLNLVPLAPGFVNIGLFPFAQGAPQPPFPQQINFMAGFFLCVRTLPFDDQLEAQTTDSQLTWTFVYTNILRVYDLLDPVMESPNIGLPLSDKSVWTTPATAQLLKQVTAASTFEEFNHMPVTREMSTGKLKLLSRFCDLVINGTLPSDDVMSQAAPEQVTVPFKDFRRDL